MDVNGNKATSYGLIAAAEKAGLQLFLGSYPITRLLIFYMNYLNVRI